MPVVAKGGTAHGEEAEEAEEGERRKTRRQV